MKSDFVWYDVTIISSLSFNLCHIQQTSDRLS